MRELRQAFCRSCGEPIYWVTTKNGKKMPINIVPYQFLERKDGNEVYVYVYVDANGIGQVKRGVKTTLTEGEFGYTSHFATCPNADQHRRR